MQFEPMTQREKTHGRTLAGVADVAASTQQDRVSCQTACWSIDDLLCAHTTARTRFGACCCCVCLVAASSPALRSGSEERPSQRSGKCLAIIQHRIQPTWCPWQLGTPCRRQSPASAAQAPLGPASPSLQTQPSKPRFQLAAGLRRTTHQPQPCVLAAPSPAPGAPAAAD